MISYKNISNNYFLIGLSTDEKPIDGITNGTAYLEMDTGTVYVLDAENARWLELGGDTPTPPVPPTPEQSYKHEINWTGFYVMDDGSAPHDGTGTFSFNLGSETSATTLTDLYNAIWESKEKIYFDFEYTEEPDRVENDRIFVKNVALFDNNSKLYMNTNYFIEVEGADTTYSNLVITSFTDTVIPENN